MSNWLQTRHGAWVCVVGLAVALAAINGCGGGGGSTSNNPGPPGTMTINVRNDAAAPMGFSFDSPVTVKSGTVVSWSNLSAAAHNVVWDSWTPSASPAPGASIATFAAGATSASWTAPTVTTSTAYDYHCSIHGPTMSGVINVTP